MFSRSRLDETATPTILLWIGRVFTGLFTLFMLLDTGIKLLNLKIVEESMAALGYPPGMGRPIGALEAIILALYLVRRTSVLGAVLFTGVFGGAIASCGRCFRCGATDAEKFAGPCRPEALCFVL